MPSCVVKFCKNKSTSLKKCQGITYHRFPTAKPWKNDWVTIIRNCRGEDQWVPSKTSVICSVHFDANDLYTTKNGLRRVVTYAVPKRLLFEPPNMEERSVEPGMTFSLQRSQQLSSHHTPITCFPSQSSSLTQQLPTVAADIQQPSSFEISTSLSFSLYSSQPPPIIETILAEPQQLLSFEASTSFSLLSPICSPSLPSTAPNFREPPVPDTPRKRYLKEKLKTKQTIIAKNKQKIKTLNQKVRRLQDRNKSLKDILKTVKKQNYVDTNQFNRLNKNIAAADLFNNYNKKKLKKQVKFKLT